MDRRRATGIGLILLSAAGFASGTILAAPVYAQGVDWLAVLAWRFLVGSVLGWAWVLLSPRRRSALRRLSRRQAGVALALGTLYTGNAGTYYAALQTLPAALASVLVYTYPVMVAILSLRFATSLPGRRPWFALVLAVVGIVLTLGGIRSGSAPPVSGLFLIMLSPVIYSVWIILSARLSGEREDRIATDATEVAAGASDAAVTTAVMMTATATVFIGLGVLVGRPLAPGSMPTSAWPAVLAIGFGASFLAIQTFYAGARRIGAAQAALVSTVEPLYIVVLAWLVLGQTLETIQLVGAALILASVLTAQTAPRAAGAPEPATPLEGEMDR